METFFTTATDAATAFPSYDGYWDFSSPTTPFRRVTACMQTFTLDTSIDQHIVAIRPLAVTYNHHAIVHVCTANSYAASHVTPGRCGGGSSQGSSPSARSAAC